MDVAVDISLYPLSGDYVPPIKDFIARISRRPGITLEYNSLSTQVRGEFATVFAALEAEIATTFGEPRRAVVVLKIIGGTPAPDEDVR